MLSLQCTKNLIYLFPEMKTRGLVPNAYIHVSVSDLYILRIDLPIWLILGIHTGFSPALHLQCDFNSEKMTMNLGSVLE